MKLASYMTSKPNFSEQLDQENCGSLVLLDENIFTSSYENQKDLLHLKKKKKTVLFSKNKNKILLWSLVPIIKPEYCKVSIKYVKQAKLF